MTEQFTSGLIPVAYNFSLNRRSARSDSAAERSPKAICGRNMPRIRTLEPWPALHDAPRQAQVTALMLVFVASWL